MTVRPTSFASLHVRVLLALAAILIAGLCHAEASEARNHPHVKLTAKVDQHRPSTLKVATRAPRKSKRVVYFVDGRRRATDHSYAWRLRGGNALRAASEPAGRHRLTTRVYFGHGRAKAKSRTVFLAKSVNPETGSKWRLQPPSSGAADGASSPDLVADFENGLSGWNLAGVGDVVPTVVSDTARDGSHSADVTLTGSQTRSELILGGGGCRCFDQTQDFFEGDEGWYGFSFLIKQMVWGHPGAHNLIYQFHSDGTGSPAFGLMLWDYAGDDGVSGGRGLWSHSWAMGGDRFLAPLGYDQWYDIAIHFKASRTGNGFYEVYLNGRLIDARQGVSMIRPDRSYAYMKNGLYRNGDEIPGTSEIRIDNARLGSSMAAVTAR